MPCFDKRNCFPGRGPFRRGILDATPVFLKQPKSPHAHFLGNLLPVRNNSHKSPFLQAVFKSPTLCRFEVPAIPWEVFGWCSRCQSTFVKRKATTTPHAVTSLTRRSYDKFAVSVVSALTQPATFCKLGEPRKTLRKDSPCRYWALLPI